ncbi:DUF4189 domain-containing protein [Xanthomonas campestris pv. paulliniae]|uniref:DUF4189 domain-containing protein n=1 Tax=Xanthomonas euvesicatoria TaxID=456327 RepID=UPI001C4664B8|nr:DUF4189 domain-containing protein [Xanthomonas euvesicatoria]MBV6846601.1 DUF4189 domain-containing protein [Xanthomonas campestris pv. paulliniae]
MLKATVALFLIVFAANVNAEQGCPAGQIPAQAGGGVTSCGPIPQGYYQEAKPRPSGRWIKTWGAIALGSKDGTSYYGIPVGLHSKKEAETESVLRCAKLGAQDCHVVVSYRNQCAAIGEPQTAGKPSPGGLIQFSRQPTKKEAYREALERCQTRNPGMQCEVIFNACSEPIFQEF